MLMHEVLVSSPGSVVTAGIFIRVSVWPWQPRDIDLPYLTGNGFSCDKG